VAASCVIALTLLVRAAPGAGLFEGMVNLRYFPSDAIQFLRLNPLSGRVLTLFAWGGYMLYELPERGVFIDPRGDTIYPGALYQQDLLVESGDQGWSDVLDRYRVALVLWPGSSIHGFHLRLLRPLSTSSLWSRIYDDGQAVIFAHAVRARDWLDHYRTFGLRYPDAPEAQVFLANAYLDASQFEAARRQLQDTLHRHPSVEPRIRAAEEELLTEASSQGRADAWFGVGLYRDVRADVRGAVDAYRRALEVGLADPEASYAREAVSRLGG
jgi:hypothetical protein